MISCQLCGATCDSVDNYISHLKGYRHSLKHLGNFVCPRKDCLQHFHRMTKFKRHLQNCLNPNFHQSSVDNQNDNAEMEIPLNFVIEDELMEESPVIDELYNEEQDMSQPLDGIISTSYDFVLKFALMLHSLPNFTKKDVFNIQMYIVDHLLQNIIKVMQNRLNSTCNCSAKNEILNIMSSVISKFDSIGSDYLLSKTLEQLNLAKNLEDPRYEFAISKEVGVVFKEGTSKFDEINTTGMIMPLKFQIKEFLSKHNRLQEILNNISKFKNTQTSSIRHYFQGSTWKKILSLVPSEAIVIPIGLYTDGMQFNNALGSHTDSVDMFYYFYPGLNDPLNKNNIHLASIVRSKFIKEYKNGRCLASLVKELFVLFKDGIDFDFDGRIVNVKFVLGQIIGDNLALNSILQYTLSFRSNFYCRICKVPRAEAEQLCEEIISELRNKESYEEDLRIADLSRTGIKSDCIFNTLPYFHCTLNLSLDLMHDFFEGTFKYVICDAIIYFIGNMKFTLEELNERINIFNYGKDDIKYIPNILKRTNLENHNLKMSAREAWQFLYLLPLYIGDKIEDDDEVWTLLITLLEIIELLLRSSFDEYHLTKLKTLIRIHNELYIKYFGTLKPKMHFMTHLPTSIKAMGPPRHYMALRMEMKHMFFKLYSHCTRNRKNIAKTLSKKYSLHFANLLLNEKPHTLDLSAESEVETQYKDFEVEGYKFFKKLNFLGTDYISGMFLPLMELGSYNLYEILEVVMMEIEEISLICTKIGTLSYEPHILSYLLTRETVADIKMISQKEFNSVPLYIYKFNSNIEVIRAKKFFQ